MLFGLVLLAFGALLTFFFWEMVKTVLVGAAALLLLLAGTITVVTKLAKRKGHRDYAAALRDETGQTNEPEA